MSTYYMPEPMLLACHSIYSSQGYTPRQTLAQLLHMKTLSLREVTGKAQGHTACQVVEPVFNLAYNQLLIPGPCLQHFLLTT